MPRFTISHHTAGPEADHYDLFLEAESILKTWRLQRTVFDAPQVATHLDNHRLQYLDYEGSVTRNRGEVKIWDTGTYTVDAWTDDLIVVAARGKQLKSRLRLERVKTPEGQDMRQWNVVDPSVPVRKLAASLLRETSLDIPPAGSLEELGAALATEEHTLLAAVDAYSRGSEVPWTRIVMDAALRERLNSERARWRHPWLDAAVAHAERLDEIAKLLRSGKPV